ncbi:MAG: hypothetical protein AAF704_16610 [Cyanobacteria bacterium P01_D01_bin.123]
MTTTRARTTDSDRAIACIDSKLASLRAKRLAYLQAGSTSLYLQYSDRIALLHERKTRLRY